jgi:peptidyl-prolyl cis-trans isomerase SurA
MNPPRLPVALTLLVLLGLPPVAAAEPIDRVTAVVNKDVILQSDIDELMDLIGPQELRGLSGEARVEAEATLMLEVLDGLIASKLIDQAMDRAAIEISDRDVEAAIQDVARSNDMTQERLFEELERQGMDPLEYRVELKKQLRQYQFMNLEIRARVDVSDEDVRAAWLQRSSAGGGVRAWRLKRILLSFPDASDEPGVQAVRDEAATLLGELNGGKDFAAVAVARSDDATTKDNGGDAGIFEPKDLSEAFAAPLKAAELGEVVAVEMPMGIWLMQVAEEVDVMEARFEEDRDELARRLYDQAMERELELWTDEERRKAHVEIFM